MAPPTAAPAHPPSSSGTTFRHESFSYRGESEFVDRVTGFVRDAVEAGEPVLVAVPTAGLELLSEPFADVRDGIRTIDMSDVGSNPGRLIGLWTDFLDTTGGRPARAVGGPVPIDQDVQQSIECDIHERLLQAAFAGRPFNLLCPSVATAGDVGVGRGTPDIDDVFSVPLPPPPQGADLLAFTVDHLSRTRAVVRSAAETAGVREGRLADLVLSVDEIVTNALTHGGAGGELRWWDEVDRFVCEVSGGGTFTDPLVGRRRPRPDRPDGRGLWLAIQLCDLVQIRNVDGGTVVRLRLDLDT